MQELPYGGWVAPRIYYMGYVGVINIAGSLHKFSTFQRHLNHTISGVRIGGLSGIYKSHDFMKGRCEKPPYDENSKRSVYHIRNLDVFRLKQISEPMDVFLSHDWPTGVYHHGNVVQLLRRKPFFRYTPPLSPIVNYFSKCFVPEKKLTRTSWGADLAKNCSTI